jgi:hypothetical protein
MVLAILAHVTGDPQSRAEALQEGEVLLTRGSASHNHLLFRRDAIDICLGSGDWNTAVHHAAELEAYARAEPTPWTNHIIARGRALVAFGRGDRSEQLLNDLVSLRSDGEKLGLRITLPEIEAAIMACKRQTGFSQPVTGAT